MFLNALYVGRVTVYCISSLPLAQCLKGQGTLLVNAEDHYSHCVYHNTHKHNLVVQNMGIVGHRRKITLLQGIVCFRRPENSFMLETFPFFPHNEDYLFLKKLRFCQAIFYINNSALPMKFVQH